MRVKVILITHRKKSNGEGKKMTNTRCLVFDSRECFVSWVRIFSPSHTAANTTQSSKRHRVKISRWNWVAKTLFDWGDNQQGGRWRSFQISTKIGIFMMNHASFESLIWGTHSRHSPWQFSEFFQNFNFPSGPSLIHELMSESTVRVQIWLRSSIM